jgi:hypothetical protein
MKHTPKLVLLLAFALFVGARAYSRDTDRNSFPAGASASTSESSSILIASEPSALGNHRKVAHYATRFEGDHSLEAATVIEQVFAHYTLYTVRLQFASGSEQSIVLTAPPGGLQPEMRDMSGDSVPNDLVLTSSLLRLPLIVLLNEGHDHLTVAISLGSFAPDEGTASRADDARDMAAVKPSGFREGCLANGAGLLLPQMREDLLCAEGPILTKGESYASSSGRAPPAVATQI